MKVVITQPTYLPWLGYFELVAQADVFVFLDTVQFERQSWESRNKIRSADGRVQWLPVPVISAPLDTLIKDTQLAPNAHGVFRKQYQTIRQALRKAPFFSEVVDLLRPHFDASTIPEKLADLNVRFVQGCSRSRELSWPAKSGCILSIHSKGKSLNHTSPVSMPSHQLAWSGVPSF